MVNRMQFYIDGAWVDPAVKKSTPVVNPATEEAMYDVALNLEVNPLKSKQLTNFRASGKDEGIRLTPPRRAPRIRCPRTPRRLPPGSGTP